MEPQKFSPTVLLTYPAPGSSRGSSGLPPLGILYERGFILEAVTHLYERSERIHAEGLEVLNGESVILRPPREPDVEAAYEWDRDPELAAWNGRSPIKLSLSAARRDYLARWQDPTTPRSYAYRSDGWSESGDQPDIGYTTRKRVGRFQVLFT